MESGKKISQCQILVIVITNLKSDYKIKVGQLISCSLYQFSSTGLNTEYSIDNDKVLSLIHNKREFTNPSKSEMPELF
jgi:hypothetical protein